MGLFGKKTGKPDKMRTMRMSVAASPKKTPAKAKKAKGKPMDFAQWVENYVKMSKGNPV